MKIFKINNKLYFLDIYLNIFKNVVKLANLSELKKFDYILKLSIGNAYFKKKFTTIH